MSKTKITLGGVDIKVYDGGAVVLSVILAVLKLKKIIDWSWVWVLAPVWISLILTAGIFIFLTVLATKMTKNLEETGNPYIEKKKKKKVQEETKTDDVEDEPMSKEERRIYERHVLKDGTDAAEPLVNRKARVFSNKMQEFYKPDDSFAAIQQSLILRMAYIYGIYESARESDDKDTKFPSVKKTAQIIDRMGKERELKMGSISHEIMMACDDKTHAPYCGRLLREMYYSVYGEKMSLQMYKSSVISAAIAVKKYLDSKEKAK